MSVVIGGGGRRPRRVVASAARRVKVKDGRVDIRTFEWQDRNWDLADRVGIVSYGLHTLTFNNLARAQIVPAVLPDDPNDEPELNDDPRALEIVNNLQGPYGGPSELVATAGVNFQIAGEGYLVGQFDEDDDKQDWDVFSSQELKRISEDSYLLFGENGIVEAKLNDDTSYVVRLWRPHPRFRKMPHARLTAVADDALEWLLLSRKNRSILRTRLSAGFFFIPDEITSIRPQEFTDEELAEADDWEEPYGANAGNDPLSEELIEMMTAPIEDENDLSAVIPWLLRGPADAGEKIRYEPWRRGEEEASDAERRLELARSIATGLDWPIEKVLGMGESAYWNAWQIDRSSFEEHMDPLLREVLRSFTTAYYRPMLVEDGMDEAEAQRHVLYRDLSNFGQLNAWERAVEAYDRSELSGDALRRYGRFHDDDKPDEEELERRRPVVVAPAEEEEAPSGENPGPPASDSEEGEEVASSLVAAVRTPGLDQMARRLASIDSGLLGRLTAACDAAVERAVEKAGAKIRSKVVNDSELAVQLREIPNDRIGEALGRFYVVDQLQFDEDDLVPPDSFDRVGELADREFTRAQDAAFREIQSQTDRELARNLEDEQEDRVSAVEWLIAWLIAFALGRLFSRGSEPEKGETRDGAVPPDTIMTAMSMAGGGGTAVPEVTRFDSGIGNGSRSADWLAQAGFFTEGYRWAYGDPGARDSNFEPHMGLDGYEFVSWEDAGLTVRASFPASPYYYPQDHSGCLCGYEKIVVVAEVD